MRNPSAASSAPDPEPHHDAAEDIARGATGRVPNVRLGTQGWNYDAWVGPFYPTGTRAADFLRVYGRAFDTVEVDSTFYAVPAAKTVRGWAERTPAHFTFALKLPQEVTHVHRLREPGDEVAARFFDVARELGSKLGPILVQCGPDFSPTERDALERFLPTLPGDLDLCIEFRQRAWIDEGLLDLLHAHGVGLALSDGRWIPRRWLLQLAERLAARPAGRVAYLRWMGPNRDLVDYSRIQVDRTRELEGWSAAIRGLAASVPTVYGYVNNHFAGHSPQNVRDLQRLLGQPVVAPDRLGEQLGFL